MQRSCSRLLTAAQMQQVDAAAAMQGMDSFKLMSTAGKAVSDATVELIEALVDLRKPGSSNDIAGTTLLDGLPLVVVVAGPGNNGGDGAIAATELGALGYEVSVLRFVTRLSSDKNIYDSTKEPISPVTKQAGKQVIREGSILTDADRAFGQWKGPLREYLLSDQALDEPCLQQIEQADIIIDALFGAGLSRPLDGVLATLVDRINASSAKVISIDVPSGLDGNTHRIDGACVRADECVTFYRYKPAHFLYPGAAFCGRKQLVQIGLSDAQLNTDWPECLLNEPAGFLRQLPVPSTQGHKFDRGHVLVRSGPVTSTGAARLSAQTALECGAGLVTLSSDPIALPVNAAHLTAVMIRACENESDWEAQLQDTRISTVVLGPGNGVDNTTRLAVEASLKTHKRCVLDADALSCWTTTQERENLFQLLAHRTGVAVLTPHEGEFARLFPVLHRQDALSKLHKALKAAKLSSSVVVLKGADTVIASPDGRSAINASAPPWLATAGAGDVLAGAIASLLAQGMPGFEAACAAVWMHGEAAMRLGYPMTAEKLVGQLPLVLNELCCAAAQHNSQLVDTSTTH